VSLGSPRGDATPPSGEAANLRFARAARMRRPALESALRATLADVRWVVESHALFLAALLIIGESLRDL